jgi:hypothetical protein
MDEAFALACEGFFDRGMGVAEGRDADAAEEVKIVVTVFVAQVDALSADEEVGIAFVGVEEQFFFCCLGRC